MSHCAQHSWKGNLQAFTFLKKTGGGENLCLAPNFFGICTEGFHIRRSGDELRKEQGLLQAGSKQDSLGTS